MAIIYIDSLELEKFPNFNFIKTWLPYGEIAKPEHFVVFFCCEVF